MVHRDLKPANILLSTCLESGKHKKTPSSSESKEHGCLKIADFGMVTFPGDAEPTSGISRRKAESHSAAVTLWYRSPELLLGEIRDTTAVDMWAVGCVFVELINLRPLFRGHDQSAEVGTPKNPFQKDQLEKIFKILGPPCDKSWPEVHKLPFWNESKLLDRSKNNTLRAQVQSRSKHEDSDMMHAYDLIEQLLEYNPNKRISAKAALSHAFFQTESRPKCLAQHNVLFPAKSVRELDPELDSNWYKLYQLEANFNNSKECVARRDRM
eukprot:CAMPEP_0182442694 /NCGR_PEP_ID=MMETSP1172-20130603/1610_1 /TAXON_ID=708627 /ORGANISM="Timspurckia oligopyrenoides, Strain CCMP3278" /LENGTH=267 /DNA_ID=CAMNT_0024637709 /DNA_START=521 /DNA_END=1324 /DNA_ORIENTATION=-